MIENTKAVLKAKVTIHCDCCGCPLQRVKTFKVAATDKEAAKAEASQKVTEWRQSLKGQNCKVCRSIIGGV